jgi:UDP-2,3-diacylglucosamine hydrolase
MTGMPDTFFVADVHLGFDNTQRQQTFVDFLAYVRSCSGDLYILGDFFDFWANNRPMRFAMQPVLEGLQHLTASGSTVGFVFGNRDFLARAAALKPFGITHLGEQADISLGDLRIHITHGYSLCQDDTSFLVYKKYAWPVWRLLDRVLPGWFGNYIVRRFVLKEKTGVSDPDKIQFQFTRSVIDAHFQRGVDVVICGHTHEEQTFSAGSKQFFSLDCWQDMVGPYLVHREGKFIRDTFTRAS